MHPIVRVNTIFYLFLKSHDIEGQQHKNAKKTIQGHNYIGDTGNTVIKNFTYEIDNCFGIDIFYIFYKEV